MFKTLIKKMSAITLLAFALMAGFVGTASATIDPSVATAFTGIQTDATSLSGIVTPIVVAILGLLIVMKLIKRFGSKL
jgi:hypothetical protein